MDISVVIVTYNCQAFIKRCIDSLLVLGSHLDLEIIAVDNASGDKTVELLRTDFPNIKVIQNTKNIGFTKANNQGIKEAKGRYIFILNSDTELAGGSLGEMVRFLDRNPSCGILGPKLLDKDDKIQFSCRAFPSYGTVFFNRYSLLTRMFPRSKYADRYLKTNWPHDTIQEVDWVSGAAMVIRKECLDEIGSFDERFFIYCEDTDICKRAKDKGWKVFYYPRLYFIHFIGGTLRRTSFLAIFWHHQSIWHYYKKHLKLNFVWDTSVFMIIFMRFVFQICLNLTGNIFDFLKGKKG
jgi:hypothetical protein